MKAKLIKKADGWYNLYNGEIGIGSTHEELQGYKLSKQNCDDIFGVIDVEKLAEEDCSIHHPYHPVHDQTTRATFIRGFNKAMELNKDKVFTLEDMMNCWNKSLKFQDHKETFGEYIQSLQQPTEIEVEIEMETKKQLVNGYRNQPDNVIGFVADYENILQPKLDSEGCLILKKI
jgi:hypothetical protein